MIERHPNGRAGRTSSGLRTRAAGTGLAPGAHAKSPQLTFGLDGHAGCEAACDGHAFLRCCMSPGSSTWARVGVMQWLHARAPLYRHKPARSH